MVIMSSATPFGRPDSALSTQHSALAAPHSALSAVHAVPWLLLVAVWAALAVLTYVTVKVTDFNFGALNLWIAMAIATVKGSLVVLYFMHLRWDRPFNAIVLIGALAFVTLFVSLALMDTLAYQPDLIPGQAPELLR
jgi:cytochrome c oxidase subunit IV